MFPEIVKYTPVILIVEDRIVQYSQGANCVIRGEAEGGSIG